VVSMFKASQSIVHCMYSQYKRRFVSNPRRSRLFDAKRHEHVTRKTYDMHVAARRRGRELEHSHCVSVLQVNMLECPFHLVVKDGECYSETFKLKREDKGARMMNGYHLQLV
jgi:hypothetical protein